MTVPAQTPALMSPVSSTSFTSLLKCSPHVLHPRYILTVFGPLQSDFRARPSTETSSPRVVTPWLPKQAYASLLLVLFDLFPFDGTDPQPVGHPLPPSRSCMFPWSPLPTGHSSHFSPAPCSLLMWIPVPS